VANNERDAVLLDLDAQLAALELEREWRYRKAVVDEAQRALAEVQSRPSRTSARRCIASPRQRRGRGAAARPLGQQQRPPVAATPCCVRSSRSRGTATVSST
jgi:hypothetical protein